MSQMQAPRRVVLLEGEKDSGVGEVLVEFAPAEARGSKLHAELTRLAGEHAGKYVAAEWLGALGWTRFLWCRK